MNCTRCGSGSRVTETRTPDSQGSTWVGQIKEEAKVATWYTSDIIARKRVCSDGHVFYTVEVACDDMHLMCHFGSPG